MEQHPIPQQIASYQFKLVGDMTLKQFSQLAGGALISLLLYASPLHPFIKWPLIIVSFLFGVALAFLPIEDRPLSTWILIFFRSIYSPTYFVWNKAKKVPEYFSPEGTESKPASLKIAEKKEAVQELLSPVVKQTEATDKLEEKEKSFLTKVSQNFIAPNTTVVISTTPLHSYVQPSVQPISQPISPPPQPAPQPSAHETPPSEQYPVVNVPQTVISGTGRSGYTPPASADTSGAAKSAGMTTGVSPLQYAKVSAQKTAASQFSKDVVPPLPSTREAIVVGQVIDSYGQIVEGAIVEIKDTESRPVRALRSNKLGHFMIATPLPVGEYVIQCEKDGYEFEPLKIRAENKIMEPIAIWASKGGVPPKEERPAEEQTFMKDFKM